MSSLIKVTHNNQLVLTTAQVAKHFGTKVNNIKNNFKNNKERFIEGIDYYFLEGNSLKAFKDYVYEIDLVSKHAPELYLWTERGSLKHMKILGTDEAWDGHEILVNTYFHVKEIKLPSYMIEDPIERAKKWIKEKEEDQLKLDKAIKEKAYISNKREATVMNKLSQIARQAKKKPDEYTATEIADKLDLKVYSSGNPHAKLIGAILSLIKKEKQHNYYREVTKENKQGSGEFHQEKYYNKKYLEYCTKYINKIDRTKPVKINTNYYLKEYKDLKKVKDDSK